MKTQLTIVVHDETTQYNAEFEAEGSEIEETLDEVEEMVKAGKNAGSDMWVEACIVTRYNEMKNEDVDDVQALREWFDKVR